MNNGKTFEIGELCVVPFHSKSGLDQAYGIVVKRNPLKLRNNFYSVLFNGQIEQRENIFIAKLKEIENDSFNTN